MARVSPRSLISIFVVIFVLLGLAAYAYIQAREVIGGPVLSISSPQNGETFASTSPEITLRGIAKNISFITINGLQIFTDENGGFERQLLLAPGYNIITVEAQDKFNRSIKKELQFVVK